MIADNEIRDANTLGICAMLRQLRGLLSLAHTLTFRSDGAARRLTFRSPAGHEIEKCLASAIGPKSQCGASDKRPRAASIAQMPSVLASRISLSAIMLRISSTLN